jgi:endonuclease/exonuclease/phosphatase family metal-dependent hydrolase
VPGAQTGVRPVTSLRIASYNLLHGIHLAAGGAVDLDAVAAAIAALDADVVALQEVDRGLARSGDVDQVAGLADRLGVTGVFCPALLGDPGTSWTTVGDGDADGPAYGVGVLSRLPLLGHDRVALPGGGPGSRRPGATPTRPGWDREPRTALAVDVATPAGPLSVITTHLSYLPWRAVRQLQEAATPGAGPRVLCGDLNLPAVAVRAVLRGWAHAGGGPTYPSWQPRTQLDHVLVDGNVVVRAARTTTRTTSDHLPLVVDVELAATDR